MTEKTSSVIASDDTFPKWEGNHGGMVAQQGDIVAAQMQRQSEIMASMAGMLKAACAKINELERMIVNMDRITSVQADALNALIKTRTQALCREYSLNGHEKSVSMCIRNDIARRYGAPVKDLRKVDLGVCTKLIELWEDSEKLFELQRKFGGQ